MMTTRHIAAVKAMLLALAVAAAPTSAWASDHDQRMPYEEFKATVEAWDGGITEWSPEPTYEQLAADAEAAIVRGEQRVVALQAITPEACYTVAHEELIDYHRSAIGELVGLRGLLETDPPIAELVDDIIAIDARLVEGHPTAFVEPDQPTGALGSGKRLDLPNVLRQLATCDDAGPSDPRPGATDFAPEDLAALIPTRVGPVSLVIESDADRDPAAVIASGPFLDRYGKSPDDLRAALGSGMTPDGEPLGIFAVRLAGVPAEQLHEPLLREMGLKTAGMPQRWVEEDQRRYLVIGPDAAGANIVVYPMGEVLFVAVALGISPPDVMAALP